MTAPRVLTDEPTGYTQSDHAVSVDSVIYNEGFGSKAPMDVPAKKMSDSSISTNELYEQVELDLKELTQAKKRFELVAAQLELETQHSAQLGGAEESLIKELEQHAKKRVKVDAKQKEQFEIIEKFIKAQPAIPKQKGAGSVSSVDLTEKTSVLSKDVISETLVDLLIRQGKRDRAIEMLKKLIWKFPQKKAYFAARIQELK
ncbi:MAG: hypothetical protein ACKOC0_00030 [Cytophagales bacterium]